MESEVLHFQMFPGHCHAGPGNITLDDKVTAFVSNSIFIPGEPFRNADSQAPPQAAALFKQALQEHWRLLRCEDHCGRAYRSYLIGRTGEGFKKMAFNRHRMPGGGDMPRKILSQALFQLW